MVKKLFFAWAVSNAGDIWWFNNLYWRTEPTKKEIDSIIQNEIKNILLEMHKEDAEPICKIIKSRKEMFVYPVYGILSLSKWYKGNSCLIGDAAHATAPHIGQGASLALEDTIVLAKCIRDQSCLTDAFERFSAIKTTSCRKADSNGTQGGRQ